MSNSPKQIKKERTPTPEDLAWRKGYDLGVQKTLRDNEQAIEIGRVILNTLDERYEFKKEDY